MQICTSCCCLLFSHPSTSHARTCECECEILVAKQMNAHPEKSTARCVKWIDSFLAAVESFIFSLPPLLFFFFFDGQENSVPFRRTKHPSLNERKGDEGWVIPGQVVSADLVYLIKLPHRIAICSCIHPTPCLKLASWQRTSAAEELKKSDAFSCFAIRAGAGTFRNIYFLWLWRWLLPGFTNLTDHFPFLFYSFFLTDVPPPFDYREVEIQRGVDAKQLYELSTEIGR